MAQNVRFFLAMARFTRRTFLAASAALGGSLVSPLPAADGRADAAPDDAAAAPVDVVLQVNGARRQITVDPRTTLLDALRERLGLTGTKKGCDHGQCGACTVHLVRDLPIRLDALL